MSTIKNPITGRDKYVISDNVLYDPITGRAIGINNNGTITSPLTGNTLALIDENSGTGGVDTSSDTVTADVMLEGFTAHDKDGQPVTGNIPTVSPVQGDGVVNIAKGYLASPVSIEQGGGGADVPFPNDPVVYISFQNSTTADTGQAMTVSGSPTLTTLWNVPCAEFHRQSKELIYLTDKITLHGSLTQSLWFYPGGYNGGYCGTLSFRDQATYAWDVYPDVNINSNHSRVYWEGGDKGSSGSYGYGTIDRDGWNNLCIVLDAERQMSALYINGERCATYQNYYKADRDFTYSEHEWEVAVGNSTQSQAGTSCKGHVASYRVYDRALSDAEIKKIYESDISPNILLVEGKFTVTGDGYVAGVYYAEAGTKGAGRRWMQEWDGESSERMGIAFDGTYWRLATYMQAYEEDENGDWVFNGEWEYGYELYYDHSRQYDEDYNIVGTPLGMAVAAPELAGTWLSAGDPSEGSITVVYGEYTPPETE